MAIEPLRGQVPPPIRQEFLPGAEDITRPWAAFFQSIYKLQTLINNSLSSLQTQADSLQTQIDAIVVVIGPVLFPAWAIGTAYNQNQIVTYANKYYVSSVAGVGTNTGNQPNTSPAEWGEYNSLGEILTFMFDNLYGG